MTEIVVKLPWPNRGLSPNSRLTIFAKARLFKAEKLLSQAATKRALHEKGLAGARLKGGQPPRYRAGTMNVQLVCTPPITRYRDEDNLIATCKAYLDGCAASLCVDDTTFHFREQVWNKAEAPGHLLLQFDWEEPDE